MLLKKYSTLLFLGIAILFSNCTNGQTTENKTNLSVTEFAEKVKSTPSATLIDVRTPDEFSKGHLQNAVNYNWNGDEFENQIAPLDKSKPVFVYCLSGGRSSAAANKLREEGFTQVYEMDGGMMKWRAANLPETNVNATTAKGMTRQQFDALINSDKFVLVDFYADWCAPCKLMEPYLKEISTDMAEKVKVVRINTEENQALCKELKVDALPVLHLYKNNSLAWSNIGYIRKADVVKQLK